MPNLAKYALKYAAYMQHYGNMRRKWRVRVYLRWTKWPEMLKYAIAYAEVCEICAFLHNLSINKYSKCINKYSKFWKCQYMRYNMRYAHFFKICDRMFAYNRYPYIMIVWFNADDAPSVEVISYLVNASSKSYVCLNVFVLHYSFVVNFPCFLVYISTLSSSVLQLLIMDGRYTHSRTA